jgi:hypothetical protein
MNPDVEMKAALVILWCSLFASFALTISSIIVWLKSKRRELLVLVHLVSLIALAGVFAGGLLIFCDTYKDRSLTSPYEEVVQEPEKSPLFMDISLDELTNLLNGQSDDEVMVYISRSDCGECEIFEDGVVGALEENHYGLLTYSTNSDRDGPRSEEMYALLEENGIRQVPYVMIIKDGQIIRSWDDPMGEADIETSIRDIAGGITGD